MRRVALLEARRLWRGWTVPIVVGVWLGAAVASLYHGRLLIERQRATLAAAPALQAEQHRGVLDPLPPNADAGDQLFYLFFHTAHEPTRWAAFSVGLRDVHSYDLKIRMLALQGQLFDADLMNPMLAAFGQFDAAFVIVFLCPLLVITLLYDVLSEEQERDTWNLVRAQPVSELHVLAMKLAVRLAAILAAVSIVLVCAIWTLGLPVDRHAAVSFALVVNYVLLWAAITIGVVALRRSSEFNVLALAGVWVSWVVIGPALLTVAASARFPTPEALELMVRQRQAYHERWDRPLAETMLHFYHRRPEWAAYPVPTAHYSNAWYYAMQERGDDEAEPAARAYTEALERRQRWTARAAALFPPALMQLALNAVAGTDLNSHLAYLESARAYHEELKRFFYPIVFTRQTVRDVRWSEAPRHRFHRFEGGGASARWPLRYLGVLVGETLMVGTILLLWHATGAPRRHHRVIGHSGDASR